MRDPAAPAIAAIAALTASVLLAGCSHREPPSGGPSAAATEAQPGAGGGLAVPRATGPIKIDGDINEPTWLGAARGGVFKDAAGADAIPFSEVRFLWDDKNLYVMLYAADNDIRAQVKEHDGPVWIDDSFALHITPALAPALPARDAPTYMFDISATGVTTDARRVGDGKPDPSWESGIVVAVDRDEGTVNDPSDEDEEWVVEAAIPLASLGVAATPGARLLVDISRCDTPRNTKVRLCGAWGTARAPRVLELGGAAAVSPAGAATLPP